MRIRHALALASVGWYLMTPPSLEQTSWYCWWLTHTGYVTDCYLMSDPQAPLSKWNDDAAFESVEQCKEAVNRERQQAIAENAHGGDPRYWTRCVASDDPRLLNAK